MKRTTYTPRKNVTALLALMMAVTAVAANFTAVYAATLTSASVSLSDSRPSTTGVTYDFKANNVTLSVIKCIKLVFSTTASGTTVPTGMSTTGVTALAGDYVPTPAGWTTTATTNGTVTFTNATGETPALASDRNITVANITNGSTAGTAYYLQVNTFANADCATSPVDTSTVQYIFTSGQSVTASVDGSLSFAIAGVTGNGVLAVNGTTISNGLATTSTSIPFGTVTTASNRVAAQDLTVSTNAGSGYTVYTRYTGQLSNGSYNIANHTGSNTTPTAFSAAGTEAFGYTTEDTTLGTGTAGRFGAGNWAAFTTSNAEVAFNGAGASNQTTRVGIQTGISGTTAPGSYATTIVYTATPVY